MRRDPTRRRVLAFGVAAVVGLAGCAGDDPGTAGSSATDDPPPTRTTSETTTRPGTSTASDSTAGPPSTAATTSTARLTATTPALDLREANVVAVSVERRDDGVRFDVTLYHDDDGEDGYANWWQVETLDGERLGRRDLRHLHGTREFTRSATIQVPPGVGCVVVRGHDQTHGYGGQAMLVTVETGATEPVGQGSARRSLADREC